MSDELFKKIQQAILSLDEDELTRLTDTIIKNSIDPMQAIEKAYTPGVQQVGERFEHGDYFLPELIQAAEMVKKSVSRLENLIPKERAIKKGKMVIGTVQGDIHDIGKNLVITWLSTKGIEIVDIGIDCPVDNFIDSAIKEKADIIGVSCLLTMTAPEQRKLIERMKERGIRERFPVIVGGAAVSREWACEIGADGFASDLKEAADITLQLVSRKKEG